MNEEKSRTCLFIFYFRQSLQYSTGYLMKLSFFIPLLEFAILLFSKIVLTQGFTVSSYVKWWKIEKLEVHNIQKKIVFCWQMLSINWFCAHEIIFKHITIHILILGVKKPNLPWDTLKVSRNSWRSDNLWWECSSMSFDLKGIASKYRGSGGQLTPWPSHPFLFCLAAAILAAPCLILPHSPVWNFDKIHFITLVTLAYADAVLKNDYLGNRIQQPIPKLPIITTLKRHMTFHNLNINSFFTNLVNS